VDDQFLYNLIDSLGPGIILSVGLICAFKAENSCFLNNLHGLTFKKLKSDFKTGQEMDGNFNLPEELNYFYIVEKLHFQQLLRHAYYPLCSLFEIFHVRCT